MTAAQPAQYAASANLQYFIADAGELEKRTIDGLDNNGVRRI